MKKYNNKKDINQDSRRSFIKKATIGTAGIALFSAKSYANIIGSNDRLNVGAIGFNGQGAGLIRSYDHIKNAMVTHICDVDSRVLDKMKTELTGKGKKPKAYVDFREMLEAKNLDAVVIATPDHMHAPIGIMAAAAGKHVYVEKPCSHNPYEGELFVQAAEKYKVKVQMGNQQRSFDLSIQAIKDIKNGLIGTPYMAKAWYSNTRGSIGKGTKPAEVPSWLNWDLYQGCAQRDEFRSNLVHYNWHWFQNYGTGEINNNGAHEIDICRWALGVDFPVKVTSSGGRLHFNDDWEFYDTQIASYEFEENKMISWEGRSCNGLTHYNRGRGATIHGTEGTILLDRASYIHYDLKGKVVKEMKKGEAARTNVLVGNNDKQGSPHMANFVDAIRGEKTLNSPISEGHKSVLLCHLGNIAQATGDTLKINPKNGHILDNDKANRFWKRAYEKGWEPKI